MSSHNKIYQYSATSAACLAALAGGTTMSWPTTALVELQDENAKFRITTEEGSWVASLLAIGAVPGALITGYLAEKLGRRITLLVLVVPFLVSWIAIGLADSAPVLYAARLLAGLSTGGVGVCCPMYIAEISSKENRGILGSFFQLFMTAGMFLTLITSISLNYQWQASILASFPLFFLVLFYFCPESPIYLVAKGNPEEAQEILEKLHGKEQAALILQDIASVTNSSTTKPKLRDLFHDRAFVMALVVAMGITASSQLCGISLATSYLETIFKVAGSSFDSKTSAVIIMGVQVSAASIQVFIIQRVGRKTLLLQNCCIALLTLTALGTYSILQESDEYDLSNLSWLPLVCLIIYIISYVWGLGPLSWMMMGEVFTSEAKEKAFAAAVVLHWLLNFACIKSFPPLLASIGIGKTFFIFAGFIFVGLLHAIIWVPETKGKTLREIQDRLYGIKNF